MAPAVELAFFCDAGAVSSSGDEKVSGWRSDGGVGLRVKSHESVLLRTDFAWGNEGFRFLFRFGPSF
jgi:outer membrane translocation and assembly module TamA